ncbi:hypothetical protein [Micromonospora sp. WMMD1082]|uniref:hypothetical protein n=1 Tax=Micromonospora sp. WMMD1082 TaxID=3016104 RepID=UPI002415F718|nr:hypothetical protein [Micromonospora sp. WMMD1082]MDG4795469.1 hypothetical protein [Micromonospora sp. WMMD1082]
MEDTSWIAGTAAALVLAALVLAALLLRRRALRRTSSRGESDTMRAARRAIRQSVDNRRRRGRGSIRGQGYGGDDNRAYDAGVTSDTGGMP